VITETIGQYRIIKKLGAGGMGEVFLAEDTFLNRQVAIKFLSPGKTNDVAAIKRLVREARAASRLNHPNICAIHEVRNDESGNYLVMQYVEGKSLDSILKTNRFEIREVLSIALQLANALAEAHAGNVIHRDIKPQNIMIDSRDQVKVLDFGLAKIEEQTNRDVLKIDSESDDASDSANAETISLLTNPNLILGTPLYMSPDHMQPEDLDARCDIFSVGVVLYEMITGEHPFLRKSVPSTISAVLTHQPAQLSSFRKDIPPRLERIVQKCLEKDKQLRYQSAAELSNDLSRLIREIDRNPLFLILARPVVRYAIAAIVLIAIGAVSFYKFRGFRTRSSVAPAAATQTSMFDSVAILPLTCQRDLEYLCDGLTESITNKLSSVSTLRVSARSSVLRYRNPEADALTAGRELGVKAVMTGKLTKQGDDFKIQIDLINVAAGSQIWGQQYTQKTSQMLLIQDDISAQIAQKLRLQLSSDDLGRLNKRYTENTEAYLLYARGRYFWNRRTVEDLKKAADYFEAAIKLDNNYALAYTGLADSYLIQTRYGVASPKELLTRAKDAAQRAITIDSELAEAHTSLAAIKADIDWDWPIIEREHRRAIELNPNYPTAHNFYAWYLMALGRFDESKAQMSLAQELDPDSLGIKASMGLPYYYSGDTDKAMEQYQKCLQVDSNFILARWYLAMAYEQKGMYDDAIAAWDEIKRNDRSPELLSNLAYAYALSGRREQALEYLNELENLSKERYVSPFQVGVVYLGLGDVDQAFSYFEKAYGDRSLPMTLNVDPRFTGIRTDPRFIKLLQYLHLAV
jgi:eukaryotic-like serine/threonine-protein kinase